MLIALYPQPLIYVSAMLHQVKFLGTDWLKALKAFGKSGQRAAHWSPDGVHPTYFSAVPTPF
jgi:hypothetical protein